MDPGESHSFCIYSTIPHPNPTELCSSMVTAGHMKAQVSLLCNKERLDLSGMFDHVWYGREINKQRFPGLLCRIAITLILVSLHVAMQPQGALWESSVLRSDLNQLRLKLRFCVWPLVPCSMIECTTDPEQAAIYLRTCLTLTVLSQQSMQHLLCGVCVVMHDYITNFVMITTLNVIL